MLGLEMVWWLPPQLLCRLHLRRIVKRQTASGSDELLGAICFGQFLSPNDLMKNVLQRFVSVVLWGVVSFPNWVGWGTWLYWELLWICIICIDANTAIVTLLGCVEKYNKLVHVWISLHIIYSCATRKYLRKNHKLRLLSSGNFNFLYHIQNEQRNFLLTCLTHDLRWKYFIFFKWLALSYQISHFSFWGAIIE